MGRIIRGLDDNSEWLEFWTNDGEYLCCDSRFDDIVVANAEAVAASNDCANQPYSVLLLYPDYVNDSGTETYYAWVEALDAIEAIAKARGKAVQANDCVDIEPDDFAPLLVTAGHHFGQPLFNK